MLKYILKEAWVPLLFFAITWIIICHNNKLSKENDRLSDNTEILLKDNGKYKDEVSVMKLTVDELKEVVASDSSLKSHLYDSLKIKEKQIHALIKAKISIKDTVKMAIYKDSIVYKDTTIQVLKFKDDGKYLKVSGIIDNDSVQIDYDYGSDADVIIYNKKMKKWWWQRIFEKPTLRATIKSDDYKCSIKIRSTIIVKE